MVLPHQKAAAGADRAESRPLSNGSDFAKARFDVAKAFTSFRNIAFGPTIPQPPPANDAVLSSIVSQNGSWTLLSNRLAMLLGIADHIAEVHQYISKTGSLVIGGYRGY